MKNQHFQKFSQASQVPGNSDRVTGGGTGLLSKKDKIELQ